MIYILTNTETILKIEVRPQAILNLKLKQTLTTQSFDEQQAYLKTSATAAYVSLNKLDQRYRASVDLRFIENQEFNFTKGSSSSCLGYALALFQSWRSRVLQKNSNYNFPIFAKGELRTSGNLHPIGHLTEKINPSCAYVEKNKDTTSGFYLCYPQDNDIDINPEQRKRISLLGGILRPASRLQSLLLLFIMSAVEG
jgi:hypothetical protein